MLKALCPILLLVVAVPLELRAALGEPADSIEADRNALSGIKRKSATSSLYTIHEIQSGTVSVREYVSASGTVFGIAWSGMAHPDLSALLGAYKAEYQEGLKQTPRKKGRRQHTVRGPRVVVEKWGHMRNLQGRAYDPALLPAGVKADEIK